MSNDAFHYGAVGAAMAALLGIAALSGCTQAQLQTAQAAGPIVQPLVKAAVGATPVLNDIAAAACAAQAAANVAGAVATQNGNAAWAQNFSQASTIAGLGCSW